MNISPVAENESFIYFPLPNQCIDRKSNAIYKNCHIIFSYVIEGVLNFHELKNVYKKSVSNKIIRNVQY